MKALLSVALLSSLLQLCSTAAVLEPLSCSEDNKDMAAHLAMHHINTHQTHGYKFKIGEISGVEVKEVCSPLTPGFYLLSLSSGLFLTC